MFHVEHSIVPHVILSNFHTKMIRARNEAVFDYAIRSNFHTKGQELPLQGITYPIPSLSLAEQSGIIFQDGIILD